MSHHFFLSYAQPDSGPLVKRFFDDLCDVIRVTEGLPRSRVVGFYEDLGYHRGAEWSPASAEALQTCRSMICLLSTAFSHSERAGKEWQVVELRRRSALERGEFPQGVEQIILPVLWSQLEGPVPRVISDLLAHPDHIHQKHPLKTMFKSSGKLGEYADLVKTLAYQICEVIERNPLPRLDSLPPMNEVHSAFHLWDEPTTNGDKPGNQGSDTKHNVVNDEFMKNLADQLNESLGRVARQSDRPAPGDGVEDIEIPPEQPESTIGKSQNEKYSVFVIDNERQILDLIEECCLLSGLFDVRSYEGAGRALRELSSRSVHQREVPDLFVVDVDKEMQGLEVIKELSGKRDVTSGIIALSANLERDFLRALEVGATTVLGKPFSPYELLEQMERCAEIGRNSRLRQKGEESAFPADVSRERRPVFLSYCEKDMTPANYANFLRRNLEARGIGVWYGPNALKPGHQWRERVRNGIAQAQIFVALITNSYESSPNCLAELTSFYRRVAKLELENKPPLLMPILFDSHETAVQNELIKLCLKKYQYVDMSSTEFVDGFTTLFGRIQNVVSRNPIQAGN